MESDEHGSDLAELRREFPAWDFQPYWHAAGSGPDARWLVGQPLEGGPQLKAPDAEAMRRKIRQAGGTR